MEIQWGDWMLLFLGIMALIISIIFFLVSKFDEHSAIITSLSRNNGYKKLQSFLLVVFVFATPLGLYFTFVEKQVFTNLEHGDHSHIINGKFGTIAFVEDELVTKNEPFHTNLLFWDEFNSKDFKLLTEYEGEPRELNAQWQPDTSEEAIFIKDAMEAVMIMNGSITFDKIGKWKLTFMNNDEKLGTLVLEVSE